LWILGRHRLLCGDSTVATDVERVLAGVEPHLMVTDPPSGLNLLVTAIILWNRRYLERAVAALRQAEDVPDQLLLTSPRSAGSM
jgi:hypothetical protein